MTFGILLYEGGRGDLAGLLNVISDTQPQCYWWNKNKNKCCQTKICIENSTLPARWSMVQLQMQSNGSRGCGVRVILKRDRGHRRSLLDLRRGRNTKRPSRKLRQRPKHGSGESIMTSQSWPRLPLDLLKAARAKSDELVEHICFRLC